MTRGALIAVAGLFLSGPLAHAAPEEKPRFEPTANYEKRTIEGWPVLVNKGLLAKEELSKEVLTHLAQQLYQIKRQVPKGAVEKIQKVTIWVEENEPHHPCMAYHPDSGWLRDHDMNPEKARCVEVANARNFLIWTHEQPWMVLHELAHAYHHQFVDGGFENRELKGALKAAKEKKLYEKVLHYDGKDVRAYALTDPMEYFAEATEAYFGSNDFYPFVNAELRKHDPTAHELIGKLWTAESARVAGR